LQKRAKVNEVMDWLNTNFYRGGPIIFAIRSCSHISSGGATRRQAATSNSASRIPKRWLQILNDYWIGPTSNIYAAIRSRSRIILAPRL